ncbi:hypothetical protein HOC13_03925 [Candidatus Woesearchaeota archaeon]|jgi:hypothetical protein|nr:hypothetical protein [Candidatus Woesearchaeota archaeon]
MLSRETLKKVLRTILGYDPKKDPRLDFTNMYGILEEHLNAVEEEFSEEKKLVKLTKQYGNNINAAIEAIKKIRNATEDNKPQAMIENLPIIKNNLNEAHGLTLLLEAELKKIKKESKFLE